MIILKLLSEEIFDFSAEQMTQAKTKQLKQTMCNEFSDIFSLCNEVLENANKPSLIKATLDTLLRFLNWIPLGYIFETQIIDLLVTRVSLRRPSCFSMLTWQFLDVPEFRNVTLKCLSEVGALNIGPEYNSKFLTLFQVVMTSINRMIPPSTGTWARKWRCDATANLQTCNRLTPPRMTTINN
jgi:exportin-1